MNSELGLLLAFFASVMALVTAAGYFWMRRIAGVAPGAEANSGQAGGLAGLLHWVGQLVPTTESDSNAVRRRLMAAGYREPSTVRIFFGLRSGAALLLSFGLGAWIAAVRGGLAEALLPALGALYVGYTLPDRVLRRLTRQRLDRMRSALPDALDLLVLCLEAGQPLDQALVEAGSELKRSQPDLGSELLLTHLELRAGVSRADALRNFAERNPEPELKKFAHLLIQADRFGTSLGPALRVHARYLRVRSKQRAEESARKISVKLLFPIFFLIFPAMMLVAAGPAVLQIFTQLLPMIGGAEP